MFKKIASTLLAGALVLSTASADAALNAYMTVNGQRSGKITGSVTQKGREGTIMVIAASHSILSPRDSRSGLPTGQRMHKPFVVTKELDKSSPLLYKVMTTNEQLSTVEIKFWAPSLSPASGVGSETQMYTVKMTNASISSIEFKQASTLSPETARQPMTEEIAFTYQKIEWTWVDGGVTFTDTWSAAVQ